MPDKTKSKVLIVDDDVFISEQLNSILEDLGYQVTEIAFNAESALQALKTNPPDIAILDINMHGRNQGFEIAKYIRENLNIPFIFLTSFADESTVNEASKLTPDGYLLKPFNEATIFSTLNIVLKRHRKTNSHFNIKIGHEIHKVKDDELLFIMSADKYIEIHTKAKKYLKRDTIDHFIQENELKGMKRVHRSYAVKIDNIDSVKGSTIYINNQEIPISNTYKEAFKKAYSSFL
ncbi:LytR/AlgR family response regulator transcription factor [Winogradskyella thalassocola]|uniref:DNA-binding response regulator, LytR/AlgR family n=1 Tax=Winogradskyella thalassocola TaxID=262004 RepID=A0A1G8LLZ2_9FLAO|nr:response regulator [Winogradskyella thalassocola]SDI56240.1 DNA-binding response regulator, LytR/AlgR family [Winogradskyella thalassocola]